MYTHRHNLRKRRTVLAAATAALSVPFVAACGGEQAGAGAGVGADAGRASAVGATTGTAERSLTGIRWQVDSITANGTTLRAPVDAHITVEDDGRTSGRYACNYFRGEIEFDGDRVRFSIDTTLMACDDEPRKTFERTLTRTLTREEGALKARVNDDRLTLTADDGTVVRLSEGGADTPLHGTKWKISTLDAEDRAHLTFDEEEGTVSGSLGCNKVNAEATVRDGHITVGTPTTTRMVCEDSLMKTEKRLLRLFDTTLSYRIDHRSMTLTSENGTSFEAFAAA
ncbi:META domain-containing protein [Streptomyces hirsutus]|uniref:META domain-containing protein n=1 Tax=Streptomyces hirsutus TaxID=35620 RepID=UPI0006E34467|nr:META domain-containing protein [Streptomyces hirsutus]